MSAEKKLENMDEFGIDCGIITPTLSILLPNVNRPRYAVALAEAYNRYIFDRFAVGNDRLKITLTVAPHKPERAAAKIEKHADKEDVVGIQMSATGLVPPPGARKYDPMYRAAEENGSRCR
jgi:predicted TIM-barrel fold metal-dependent hydrolase